MSTGCPDMSLYVAKATLTVEVLVAIRMPLGMIFAVIRFSTRVISVKLITSYMAKRGSVRIHHFLVMNKLTLVTHPKMFDLKQTWLSET